MKLTFFRWKVPNFGDELNEYVWPRLLRPGFLDEDPSVLFLGIGSILFDHYPPDATKIVVGSGYGGYTDPPDVHDGKWDIAFVRGPRTAERLNLPRSKAITDSAILLRAVPLPDPDLDGRVVFIPHYESIRRGQWADVCRLAGIKLIDPTDPVETVLSAIRGARLVITEAMHGAITADALRVPWIGVEPIHPRHRAKWFDWTESLDIPYRPHPLRPSTALEAYSKWTGREGKGGISSALFGRAAYPINLTLRHAAAHQLLRLSREEPVLSSDRMAGEATERALAAVESIQARYS